MEFTQARKTARNSTNALTESSGRIRIARRDFFSIRNFLFVISRKMSLADELKNKDFKKEFSYDVNTPTSTGHKMADLNLKRLPFSTGMSDSRIFCNVSSLNINLPNSRISNFHFFEILIGKFRNRPSGGRLLLRGY
jgi:hypothetical protein